MFKYKYGHWFKVPLMVQMRLSDYPFTVEELNEIKRKALLTKKNYVFPQKELEEIKCKRDKY